MALPVRTILFDLDETLCERPPDSEPILARAFRIADADPFFDRDDYHRVAQSIGERTATSIAASSASSTWRARPSVTPPSGDTSRTSTRGSVTTRMSGSSTVSKILSWRSPTSTASVS